ncbi:MULTISPECIES: glycosyltransferase family 4 protein [Streptomyces]|uniref:Glycosyltransferase n=1 Tax=Streptomyces venezuelae (strain ATCC 10712 / CBS 650.69 / DSM 40230 / JCM 4526 / NBRC 13096 / PD 04745) TaxID=953739 RepID=F2RLU6_STRVP|nr:glycosyltransferase family 4 protein [Streptomyces venezuelae]APE25792.1 glycosyl transferase [Streptomyces venezuelae]QES03127.1 glycosyltransferase family 1 protein [Streptomyces venezuelae ATCC 10712]QES10163.1 glycosyltransferase family 1 protein [Streptomyces venezuelae]CCA60476.1 Glycosyltransferase [Streptomyces venezuelae ATCC 10712]
MHVLVVHNRYSSAQPSGENRVVDEEVGLLRAAGHRVDVFERRSDDIAARSLLGKVAVPLLVPWNPAVRTELAARLRAERPDVVHVHNVFPLLSPAVLAACADAGVPVVATLHNYTQVCPPGTLHRDGRQCTECVGSATSLPAVRHGCYRDSRLATVPLAVSLAVNRRRWWSGVERFFCISGAQRDILVRSGMPAERLAVKHNFVPDPGTRRTGPGEHVLFLGRLAEAKGVRLLMAAWDELAATGGVGVPLVIAGAGPLEPEVTAWAAGRDDVRLAGLWDPEECRRGVARSVAVVAPSLAMETFGLVVAEAMAAGVPSVAAGHGAFVELVEDGVTGLLHRPGDASSLASRIRRIAGDQDRNGAMGRAARLRYEQGFSPAVGLDRLVEGYRAAIAGRSGGGEAAPPVGNEHAGPRRETRAGRDGGSR